MARRCVLRRASSPIRPRPPAKSGSAAGNGVAVTSLELMSASGKLETLDTIQLLFTVPDENGNGPCKFGLDCHAPPPKTDAGTAARK
jgi:hypothetical protein